MTTLYIVIKPRTCLFIWKRKPMCFFFVYMAKWFQLCNCYA